MERKVNIGRGEGNRTFQGEKIIQILLALLYFSLLFGASGGWNGRGKDTREGSTEMLGQFRHLSDHIKCTFLYFTALLLTMISLAANH